MRSRAFIKPSRSALIAGIVATSLLMVFGVVFLILLKGESQVGTIFLIFWLTITGLMLAGSIYTLVNYDKNKGLGESISLETDDANHDNSPDFDEQLRRLKKLEEQGVITRAEFEEQKQKILGHLH